MGATKSQSGVGVHWGDKGRRMLKFKASVNYILRPCLKSIDTRIQLRDRALACVHSFGLELGTSATENRKLKMYAYYTCTHVSPQ